MRALTTYHDEIGASAGRGGYARAVAAARLLFDTRDALARLFGVPDSKRVVFTLNATEAINLALQGYLAAGDHVVTTSMEHNSVARPLRHLERDRGIKVTFVPCSSEGLLDPASVDAAIGPDTKLVAVIHASNVCGAINDVAAVGEICRRRGVRLFVDAAQTAGSVPIHMEDMGIDLLAFPGHKGLMGPLGTGCLCLGADVELRPLVMGGTGTNSGLRFQPDSLPDRYEAGSHNALGIAGLKAAVDFVSRVTPQAIGRHKASLAEMFAKAVGKSRHVRYYGPSDFTRNAGVCSVTVEGMDAATVGLKLDAEYGIMVRTGLHCAPLAHETLGTTATGTVRFSFGFFNTREDAEAAASALLALAEGPRML